MVIYPNLGYRESTNINLIDENSKIEETEQPEKEDIFPQLLVSQFNIATISCSKVL
jgi:hypothetical protein